MSTTTFKRAFGFLLPVAVLSFLAPFYSHLHSMAVDVDFYFSVDRSTLFFFCNVLLLFLARDSGFLAFFAPANSVHDESHVKEVPVRRSANPEHVGATKRVAGVAELEKVGAVESVSSSELGNEECSELMTSAVNSAETASDVELSEEAVMSSSDSSELDDDERDEEMVSADDGEDEHEELEEFNRRCEEFIARMKSGRRTGHAVGVTAVS